MSTIEVECLGGPHDGAFIDWDEEACRLHGPDGRADRPLVEIPRIRCDCSVCYDVYALTHYKGKIVAVPE